MTERITLKANGVEFVALTSGEGPVALCLHGFPDTAETWKELTPVLVDAGYRVVAPYMRGYAPTGPAPDGIYAPASLGRDAVGIIDTLGGKVAALIGHDWGAIAASFAALHAPEKIDKLVTMAVPCGPGLGINLMTNYAYQKKLWYQYLFQLPIAETLVSMNDMAFIRNLWQDWSPSWDFSESDIAPVLECLATDGTLSAALAYYHSLFDPSGLPPELAADSLGWGNQPIEVETLHIHGAEDGCIAAVGCDGMEALYPKGLQLEVLAGAGHFTHRESPTQVAALVGAFLS